MSDSDFSYADEGGDNANKENTPIAYPQIFVQDGARLKFFFSNSVTPGQQKVLAQQINRYAGRVVATVNEADVAIVHPENVEQLRLRFGCSKNQKVRKIRVEGPKIINNSIVKGRFEPPKSQIVRMGGKAPGQGGGTRTKFTAEDDDHLAYYLSARIPDKPKGGRTGVNVYKELMLLADSLEFSWVNRHPWQAWRERYTKRQDKFDDVIADYVNEYPPPATQNGIYQYQRFPKVLPRREEEEEEEEEEGGGNNVDEQDEFEQEFRLLEGDELPEDEPPVRAPNSGGKRGRDDIEAHGHGSQKRRVDGQLARPAQGLNLTGRSQANEKRTGTAKKAVAGVDVPLEDDFLLRHEGNDINMFDPSADYIQDLPAPQTAAPSGSNPVLQTRTEPPRTQAPPSRPKPKAAHKEPVPVAAATAAPTAVAASAPSQKAPTTRKAQPPPVHQPTVRTTRSMSREPEAGSSTQPQARDQARRGANPLVAARRLTAARGGAAAAAAASKRSAGGRALETVIENVGMGRVEEEAGSVPIGETLEIQAVEETLFATGAESSTADAGEDAGGTASDASTSGDGDDGADSDDKETRDALLRPHTVDEFDSESSQSELDENKEELDEGVVPPARQLAPATARKRAVKAAAVAAAAAKPASQAQAKGKGKERAIPRPVDLRTMTPVPRSLRPRPVAGSPSRETSVDEFPPPGTRARELRDKATVTQKVARYEAPRGTRAAAAASRK